MRRQDIPAQAFERLADEGLRMTTQRLRDLRAQRRHAALCATVIKLESLLTDAALSMFDKLMGSVSRKASRRNDTKVIAATASETPHVLDGLLGHFVRFFPTSDLLPTHKM